MSQNNLPETSPYTKQDRVTTKRLLSTREHEWMGSSSAQQIEYL